MKLIVLSAYSPYPTMSGGRQRTAALITALRERHQVQLISFAAGEREKDLLRSEGAIAIDYQYQMRDTSLPPSLWPFASQPLRDLLWELRGQDYEATLFDQIFISGFQELAPGKTVLLEANIESDLLLQQARSLPAEKKRLALAQHLALRAYESKTWPRFDLRCAVSEQDAQQIRSRCPDGPTLVVPNGVDLERAVPLTLRCEPPSLLFVGALDYPPNRDAVTYLLDEIMPRVWEEAPTINVKVIGRGPDGDLRARLQADARLSLHADVPQVEPLARDCFLSVVPLRMGSGTRLKILEASAWGMPVVTTSLGCQGLPTALTEHLAVADTAGDFAAAILRLWRDAVGRHSLANKAQAVTVANFSWPRCFRPLLDALERAVAPL